MEGAEIELDQTACLRATMTTGVSFPAELVAAVLDYTDIQQLVAVSHVCALWRTTAHAHPVFWRDVSLTKLTLAAATFFDTRLRSTLRGSGISVSIDIEFNTEDEQDVSESIVFPAVKLNLCHIIRLSLRLPEYAFDVVVHFLEHPAPMLKTLSLAATGDRYLLQPRTAERLFGGRAPELREIELREIQLLDSSLYCNFLHGIESVRLVYNALIYAPGFFPHFPSLRNLDVHVDGCAWGNNDASSLPNSLASFRVFLRYGGYVEMFDAFTDLGNITNISCWLDESYEWRTVFALLGVFDEKPLKLSLLDDRSADPQFAFDVGVMFSCAAASRDHTRSFHVLDGGDDGIGYLANLFSPDIRARVSHLRVPAQQTGSLAALTGELPRCHVLEIEFADGTTPSPLPANGLRLPILRTVVLAASGPGLVSVSGEQLSAFLCSIVADPTAALEISTVNFRVVGDLTSLSATFADLQTVS